MKRGTKTTAAALQIGDRFYKSGDKARKVLQIIDHKAKSTKYRTYTIWCIPDGRDKRYPDAINKDTEVIFLRHTTTE